MIADGHVAALADLEAKFCETDSGIFLADRGWAPIERTALPGLTAITSVDNGAALDLAMLRYLEESPVLGNCKLKVQRVWTSQAELLLNRDGEAFTLLLDEAFFSLVGVVLFGSLLDTDAYQSTLNRMLMILCAGFLLRRRPDASIALLEGVKKYAPLKSVLPELAKNAGPSHWETSIALRTAAYHFARLFCVGHEAGHIAYSQDQTRSNFWPGFDSARLEVHRLLKANPQLFSKYIEREQDQILAQLDDQSQIYELFADNCGLGLTTLDLDTNFWNLRHIASLPTPKQMAQLQLSTEEVIQLATTASICQSAAMGSASDLKVYPYELDAAEAAAARLVGCDAALTVGDRLGVLRLIGRFAGETDGGTSTIPPNAARLWFSMLMSETRFAEVAQGMQETLGAAQFIKDNPFNMKCLRFATVAAAAEVYGLLTKPATLSEVISRRKDAEEMYLETLSDDGVSLPAWSP